MRQWKIALSLAIVGAVAAPFVFRLPKARITSTVFVPLTAEEKAIIVERAEKWPPNCAATTNILDLAFCSGDKDALLSGGHYYSVPSYPRYLAVNLGVALAAFAGIYGLAFLVPMLIRRYWRWLNT